MTLPDSMDAIRKLVTTLPDGDDKAAASAAQHQMILTKPAGSLGRLEELAIFLARWQKVAIPQLQHVEIIIFAGTHGIAARGVSAYPPQVTAQMVGNFAAGDAAINQLARQAGAALKVVPLALERPTADFTVEPAMSEADFVAAVTAGMENISDETQLVCLGEMGIGNTTAAAAVAAALYGGNGENWVGRGTGIDDAGLARKAAVVDAALGLHASALADPLEALRRVGGRELAAIFGATLAARLRSIPVLIDGFVASAAAAPLACVNENGLAHALAGHVSAEAGHRTLLRHMQLQPILDLGMRLGEASGACLAINVLQAALACHSGMATFEQAGVSEG